VGRSTVRIRRDMRIHGISGEADRGEM
jgi:hypothetical protein